MAGKYWCTRICLGCDAKKRVQHARKGEPIVYRLCHACAGKKTPPDPDLTPNEIKAILEANNPWNKYRRPY